MTAADKGDSFKNAALIGRRALFRCPQVRVTELGFGGAAIGNLFSASNDEAAGEAVSASIRGGIHYFDTAPYYGYGLSEMRFGKYLNDSQASEAVVSTKVGIRLRSRAADEEVADNGFVDIPDMVAFYDYSRSGILKSLEESRERLCRQKLDIVFLHDIGRRTHGDDHEKIMRQVYEEGIPALAELKGRGVISAFGIGVSEAEVCLEILERVDLDCILLAGRYTLLEQGVIKDLLPLCVERRVGVIVGGPFNSGLLAGATAPGTTYEYAPVRPEVLLRAQRLYSLCGQYGVEVGAAALQFPLAHPSVISVIPGCRNRQEILANIRRYAVRIPTALWSDLKNEGLIDVRAPCPE